MSRGVFAGVVAIFGAITAVFADVLFLGRSLYLNDLLRYHFGMKRIVRDAMLSGGIPYWHDAFGGGQPLAANPAFELFYPLQWLILVSDLQTGITLHIVAHVYLCAFGLFALLRSLGVGVPAATTGTIAFVLGGPLMSLVRVLPFLFAVSWMPLIFLFVRRRLITRGRRDFLLAALAAGMQALVGEPLMVLETWLIVAAYAAYRALQAKNVAPELRRNALAILGTGVIAIAIAAAQLIPGAAFARDTTRALGLEWDIVSALSMSASRLGELFVPRASYGTGEVFIAALYFGLAIAVPFAAGFFVRHRGRWLVAGILGTAFLLALGANTPLLRMLYEIGLFRSLRYPEKFFIAALLVAAVWGSLMLDRLLRGDAEVRKWTVRVAIAWGVLAVLILLATKGGNALGIGVRGAILAAVLVGMRKKPALPWGVTIAALTIVDVLHVDRLVNPTMPRGYYDPPAAAAQLPPNRHEYRLMHWAEWMWALESVDADRHFADESRRWWAIRNAILPRTTAGWGIQSVVDPDYDATYLIPTGELVTSVRDFAVARANPAWQQHVLAMSNAWYVTRFRPAVEGNAETAQVIDIVPVPVRLPRFYLADSVVESASRADFDRLVTSGTLTPRAALVAAAPFTPAGGDVRVMKQHPGHVVLDVRTSGRAMLVASITPHRHWRASVNGSPAELRVANLAYQALELPAGRHTVEMRYRDPLVLPSAAISLLAFLATLVAIALSPRTAMPQKPPQR